MTLKEAEIFALACRYLKDYKDSNPDVGMGPSNASIIQEVADKLSFEVDADFLALAKAFPEI